MFTQDPIWTEKNRNVGIFAKLLKKKNCKWLQWKNENILNFTESIQTL